MCRGLPRPTPRLVADTDLQRANAARAAIGQASIVAGPAVGSLLLAVCSPPAVILLNAISFLASAATVAAIRPGPAFAAARRASEAPSSLLGDVRAGAAALRGAPRAVRVVTADVMCSAEYGLLTVTLVLVGLRVGAGGNGYGLLLARSVPAGSSGPHSPAASTHPSTGG